MADNGNGTADGSPSRKRNDDGDFTSGNRKRKTTSDLDFVEVEENGSNDDVKIRSKDTSVHRTVLQGQGLENMDTLANVPIKNESTLILKRKIESKLEIPCDKQALILDETVLHDKDTIADSRINKKSKLTLMHKSRGFIHIFIKTFTQQTIILKVKHLDTIGSIKTKIKKMVDIPFIEQELICDGMVLHNDDSLDDFGIDKESTLILTCFSRGLMHIFIQTLTGKIITLDVKPSHTIDQIVLFDISITHMNGYAIGASSRLLLEVHEQPIPSLEFVNFCL
ncbi:hypothetical protein L1987_84221 [Smallanthus sonchifolius]|uniref:Uncharacterized protein n=1 Tax=Smallanthus sonchifolius TaxID=185202 RepID=A0ACB8YEA4_9ASTR|nr:hypothetical protein L1987_84221 [Smallanthus sonchifolius]